MARFFISSNPLTLGDINPSSEHGHHSKIQDAYNAASLHNQAVICINVLTRQPVMRAEWGNATNADDTYLLLILPAGGGKSNPLQLLLQFAMLAVGFVFAGATWLGWTGALAKAGMLTAGSLLANALMPSPSTPQQQSTLEAAPTYNIRSSGNQLGLGLPIPVQAGRVRSLPPLIAHPYYEYDSDDEQTIHLLYLLGEGEFNIHKMRFADLDVSQIDGFRYEVVYNGSPTLIPATVYTSDEIDSVEVTGDWSVSAYSNPPSTTVTAIAWDTGLLRGLGQYDNKGNLNTHTVATETRYRRVNDTGSGLTDWTSILDTFSAKTLDAVRRSKKINVAAGRYEVQRRLAVAQVTQIYEATDSSMAGWTIKNGEKSTYDILCFYAGATTYNALSSTISSAAASAYGTTHGAYLTRTNQASLAGKQIKLSVKVYAHDSKSMAIAYACGTSISSGWRTFAIPATHHCQTTLIKPPANTLTMDFVIPSNAPTTHYIKLLADASGTGKRAEVISVTLSTVAYIASTGSTDSKIIDDVTWGGLRGYNYQHRIYDGVTVIAATVTANEQLSGSAQGQFSVDATAKIPKWNGSAWSAAQDNQSGIWFIANILRNQIYGARWNDNRIPASDFLAIDNQLKLLSYNPTFNYRFEQRTTIEEAIQTAARCLRIIAWQQSGYIRLWRDSNQTTITQLFTADDISDLTISYETPLDVPVDGVSVGYVDNDTGQPKQAIYLPSGSVGDNIEELTLAGCTSRNHAYAEARYLYEADTRRGTINFVAGLQGRIPSIGDLIAIDRDGGHIVGRYANELVLSSPVDFYDGNGMLQQSGKIQLRARNGVPISHFYTCTGGQSSGVTGKYRTIIITDAAALPTIDTLESTREATRYTFWVGDDTDRYYQAVVTSIQPDGERIRISAGIKVDIADDGMPDSDTGKYLGKAPSAPLIKGIKSTHRPVGRKIEILLSWQVVHFASRYEVHAQLADGVDDGVSTNQQAGKWAKIYLGTGRSCKYTVSHGEAVNFRLRAIGAQNGAWVYYAIIARGN